VRITVRNLKKIIRETLGGIPSRPIFGDYIRNAMSPEVTDREQLGWLADEPTDIDDETGLASHLVEPGLTPEECWGPVPPLQGDPWIHQDLFTRDTSPIPTPPIQR
jgi:hypothetical protein